MIDVISARVHLTLYRAHFLGYVYVYFIINNLFDVHTLYVLCSSSISWRTANILGTTLYTI